MQHLVLPFPCGTTVMVAAVQCVHVFAHMLMWHACIGCFFFEGWRSFCHEFQVFTCRVWIITVFKRLQRRNFARHHRRLASAHSSNHLEVLRFFQRHWYLLSSTYWIWNDWAQHDVHVMVRSSSGSLICWVVSCWKWHCRPIFCYSWAKLTRHCATMMINALHSVVVNCFK